MDRTPLFFMVGVGRSGTTLFHRLMDCHPKLGLTNEAGLQDLLHFFARMASVPAWQPTVVNRGTSVELHGYVHPSLCDEVGEMVRQHALDMLFEFYEGRFRGRDIAFFGDKLPDPEAVLALAAALPDVRAALLIRDPRDVLCSMRSYGNRVEVSSENRFFRDNSAEQFATHWNNLYAHFPEVLTNTALVRYEDLVSDPITCARSVMTWLGLNPDEADSEALSERARFDRHGTSASSAQSVERWRRDLGDSELRTIESRCAETMRRYGYSTSDA